MVANQTAGGLEALDAVGIRIEPEGLGAGLDRVHDLVMEAQEREMELRDDQVLVVAQITD